MIWSYCSIFLLAETPFSNTPQEKCYSTIWPDCGIRKNLLYLNRNFNLQSHNKIVYFRSNKQNPYYILVCSKALRSFFRIEVTSKNIVS